MEAFEYQTLRNIVKENGSNVLKDLGDKYREVKVDGNRDIVAGTLYMGSESKTLYMESECEARKRYQGGYRLRSFYPH